MKRMLVRITEPSQLIHFLHDSVTRHRQHLSDPTAWPQDIALSEEGIRSDEKAIETSMPQQAFDRGFWRNLMDYTDSGHVEGLLVTVAAAHGLGVREARGEFFEEVVNACQMTFPPRPPRGANAKAQPKSYAASAAPRWWQ